MSSCCSFLEILKLGKIALFFPELHAVSRRQLALIFLLKLVDCCRLDCLWLSQLKLVIHAALVLNEFHHVPLHKWHAQNLEHLGTLLFIFDKELGYKVFEFGGVHIRDRALLVLDNLKNETEKILAGKSML